MSNNGKRVTGQNPQVVELKSYAHQSASAWSASCGVFKHNKKWWLLPLLTILVGFGAHRFERHRCGTVYLLSLLTTHPSKLRITHAVHTWNQLCLP